MDLKNTNFLKEEKKAEKQKKAKSGFLSFFKKKKVKKESFKSEKEDAADYQNILKEEKESKSDEDKKFGIIDEAIIEGNDEKKKKEKRSLLSFGTKRSAIKTNLITDESVVYYNWKNNIVIFTVSVGMSILIILGLYVWLEVEESKMTSAEGVLMEDIKDLEDNISDLKKEMTEADIFQDKLVKVSELLDRHVYWTNLFEFLEDNILSNVWINGDFDGKVGGRYSLTCVTDNYSTIDKQIAVLKKAKYVKNVIVSQAVYSAQDSEQGDVSVEFTIDFELEKEIMYK